MKHQQNLVCSTKNNVLFILSFTLILSFFFFACTKTVSTNPTSLPTPPPVVKNAPSNVDFEVDLIVYNFQYSPEDSTTSVTIDAKAENATSYKWDFGDGTTETTQACTVTHKYQKSGDYAVSLIALNGTQAAPEVKKSIGTINVFNGGMELTTIDQNKAPEYPWVTDVSTIPQPGAIKMYFYLVREHDGSILFQDKYPCISNLQIGTSKLFRSSFSFDNIPGTLEMPPCNKAAFRFNLIKMKVESDGRESVDHVTADYRNVTASVLWKESLTEVQKGELLTGQIVSKIRILENRKQSNENAQLYFNAQLTKI